MRFGFTLLTALCLVGGSVAGCKKSGDASVAQMTELKTKMCACKDKACIDQVTADMAKWSAEHRGTAPEKASEEDQKKLAAISTEMTDCMTRVMRDESGRPVEVIQALYRPDKYEYRVNLSRDNGDAPRWTVKIDR